MLSHKINTIIQTEGVLHLTGLPYHRGDRVEGLVTLSPATGLSGREHARERFLARARQSRMCSQTPYPRRDE